jgi:mitotic spindle assembly checkpoint protein MAD1
LTQHADLESALASLQAAHDLLERRVARGEYNPETFQCLQLALNPSTMDLAVRTETLEGLKRENEALLKAGTGEVPRETYERVLKEREEERLQMEKRLQRLKEVRLVVFAHPTLKHLLTPFFSALLLSGSQTGLQGQESRVP